MYATLGDSYEFQQLNLHNALMNKVENMFKNGITVSPKQMPSSMLKLKNRIKSILFPDILERINSGDLIMKYSTDIKIPLYLPFIVLKNKPNSSTGIVFLNNLEPSGSPLGENNELVLNENKFIVSLESCYIGMIISQLGDTPKLHSNAIIKSGSRIYSGIIAECLNRLYGIKLDPIVYGAVIYLSSYYYIYTMIGYKTIKEEVLNNYCLYNCPSTTNYIHLRQIIDQVEPNDFTNISSFIQKIKQIPQLQARLGKLTVSGFTESIINMYDTPMLFALENFNYFLFNILSVNRTTYTNNYELLKNIIGSDGKIIYSDIISGICN